VAKAILKVPVDDKEFKSFQQLFEKYNTELKKTPGYWKNVDRASSETGKGFRAMTATLLAQQEITRRGAANQQAISSAAKSTESSWSRISTKSKETAANIAGSTRNLLKWAGVVGAVGSLLGLGGSLWGLDRLANSASAGRRSASGLGLTYGEQQAFGVTYSRLVDTGSFMGGISQARGNVASPAAAAIYALGLDPTRGNGGQLAGDALDRVRDLTKRTPDHLLGILPQTHNLGELGLGTEDLRRIKNLSEGEYSQYKGEYAKRQGQFNVGDPALKAGQDLAVALDAASQKIKSVFLDGLGDIAPILTKISDGLSDVVQSIFKSQGVKDGLKWVASGLHDFASYIQKEDFKKDIKDFVAGIGSLAKAVADGLRWLGILPSQPNSGTGVSNGTPALPPLVTREAFDKQTEEELKKSGTTGIFADRYRKEREKDYRKYLDQRSSAGSVPGMDGYMNMVAGIESAGSGGYGAVGPDTGKGHRAYGKYQVMDYNIGPWTKEHLGKAMTPGEFLANQRAQDEVFRREFGKYLQQYGNVNDALSMWHSGRPLAQAKAAGARDQNMTTEEYVRRATGGGTKIVIENNTGGNTIVSTNQLAY
jgi:hypothetical protein